jgi:16S rRNA (guanine966-N2)-methyltransferase
MPRSPDRKSTSGRDTSRNAPREGPRQLRIIAGQWRGRRLRFPPGDIRPTPDRVRETLFNWLQQRVAGAHCLDVFAGSGALGLEALSRGAASVVFIERDRASAQALRATLAEWQAQGAQVQCTEALQYLRGALAGLQRPGAQPSDAQPSLFDLVFLDPPYAAGAELAEAAQLLARGLLRAGSHVYVEHARRSALPSLPGSWREVRTGAAGEVGYHLFEVTGLFETTGGTHDEIQRGLSGDV